MGKVCYYTQIFLEQATLLVTVLDAILARPGVNDTDCTAISLLLVEVHSKQGEFELKLGTLFSLGI